MSELESEQKRPSVEQAEPAANHQPTVKELREIAPSVANSKLRDQALYGPAPLLPFESEERYGKITDWLKPSFGGYQSRFEYHLLKEMVDSVLMQQRWDQAEAALTNRLGRQLMEAEGPSTLIDFEALLSDASVHQLLNLPAPRNLSDQALAKLEAPPPLRAVALVKNQPTRAAIIRRSELASKRFDATSDLLVFLRERRAQLFSMDHFNGLAQVRIPNSIYEPDAEKITPDQRRKEQQRRRLKNRIIYAVRNEGWTKEGLALLGADVLLRGESAWAFANLYLDIEEYFGVEWPGDVLILFKIAKETWRIRRLNEAAHQTLLMKFEAIARKYVASDSSLPKDESRATPSREDRGSLLVRELVAAGSGPSVVLAEALQEVAPILDLIDQEIAGAYARRLDHVRRFTRLRGKKLQTEFHHIQGAGYRNRGEWESW